MEVSSHALALDRVAGTTFEVAGFTNLSQDHLDFHPDMEHYFAAKQELFTSALSRRAVVTVDDDWGRRLAAETTLPVVTIGAADADWRRTEEQVAATGGSVTLVSPAGEHHRLDVALPGAFNLRNAALAFVVLLECGVDAGTARDGIAGLRAVPGRMEPVDVGQPFAALVDYAHTPDAVAALLDEARVLAAGARVIVVLGCGGDRDAAKRPLMGEAAARGANLAVLTSDNPRSEDPAAILAAMEAGARAVGGAADVVAELDRRTAIRIAVAAAGPGDVLVVAGKGHEQGQELADRTVPFDDRVELREALLQQLTVDGRP
jgi:UDP-N-acetylmuramoyl-L-alanyl-D-glutamate--2,6-diaminopimelate ligase